MFSQVDDLLRSLSKAQSLDDVMALLRGYSEGDILVLILRALTDKGFKAHASLLSQEWFCQEDLDGDGLIYGLDWHYENPPPLLQSIPKGGQPKKFTPRR